MISATELRQYVDLSVDAEVDMDAEIAASISQFEDLSGRKWNRRVGHTQVFAPPEFSRILLLELFPIETLTKVEERDASSGSVWETLDVTAYEIILRNQLERLDDNWRQRVRVTYTGGYVAKPASGSSQQETPAHWKKVLALQIKFSRERNTGDKITAQGAQFQGGSVTFEKNNYHPLFWSIARNAGKTW